MFAVTNDTNEAVGINIMETDGVALYVDSSYHVMFLLKKRSSGFDTWIIPFASDLEDDSDNKHDVALDLILTIKRTTLVKVYVMILIGAMCKYPGVSMLHNRNTNVCARAYRTTPAGDSDEGDHLRTSGRSYSPCYSGSNPICVHHAPHFDARVAIGIW